MLGSIIAAIDAKPVPGGEKAEHYRSTRTQRSGATAPTRPHDWVMPDPQTRALEGELHWRTWHLFVKYLCIWIAFWILSAMAVAGAASLWANKNMPPLFSLTAVTLLTSVATWVVYRRNQVKFGRNHGMLDDWY
ncbi:MAG: hypothetical protein KDC35_01720 [Acidobacteria bacterium]|nr:hypothetical protein [Acidobacteriota bacterium]